MIILLAVIISIAAAANVDVIKSKLAELQGSNMAGQLGQELEPQTDGLEKRTDSVQNQDSDAGSSDNGTESSGSNENEPPANTEEDEIQALISTMSLDEKIGQMLIIGFDGYKVNTQVVTMIKDRNIGGVILFNRNVQGDKQLVQLNNELKSLNKNNRLPLFISADHEGGRISRLPRRATDFPPNLAIGKKDSTELSQKIGSVLGSEMKAYGFNLDFAPVLDIFSNPKNTVIGDRSFGKDPYTVGRLGIATMKGIKSAGVIPVAKHFPGHGDTTVDSHMELPISYKSLQQLKSFELLPFGEAIEQGADIVMVAHIKLPEIDKSGLPASLSSVIITNLLRDDMGFDGVVITDDMEMGAIVKHYNIGDAAVKAIEAGADIILVCHTYKNQIEAIEAISEAVNDGRISQQRIDQSVRRIVMLKQKYELSDEPGNIDDVFKYVGSKAHKNIADEVYMEN
ncbi:beta-N-acetylhexosaminidase [Mahella australiensis]|uniref:beta-N-acetylhexosaminidase n=1 Tax=Mahella australiensis TaxID=252966 RepID=UPI0002F41B1C|nr:beta-N-acetylhexosaminidase [Mahella australiensis]